MRSAFRAVILVFLCAAMTAAQRLPAIGIIEFYGLRSVKPEAARKALQIKEGAAVPQSKAERDALEKRLVALPNVAQAKISFVCCDADGKTILYAGILEKGQRSIKFRAAPKGSIRLPAAIIADGENFLRALMSAVQKGEAEEDDSEGHSLLKNREARLFQEKFLRFAGRDLKLLKKVLRESSDAKHRALAAQIIAYYSDKRMIVADLVEAMRDADEAVRNNAMRALALIARYAQNNPQKKIDVPIAPFVELLDSIEWSDRNKSSLALLSLTEKRDEKILARLRENALLSLIEMARWQNPGHAAAPFFILGRTVDLTDQEIETLWINKMSVEAEDRSGKSKKSEKP